MNKETEYLAQDIASVPDWFEMHIGPQRKHSFITHSVIATSIRL